MVVGPESPGRSHGTVGGSAVLACRWWGHGGLDRELQRGTPVRCRLRGGRVGVRDAPRTVPASRPAPLDPLDMFVVACHDPGMPRATDHQCDAAERDPLHGTGREHLSQDQATAREAHHCGPGSGLRLRTSASSTAVANPLWCPQAGSLTSTNENADSSAQKDRWDQSHRVCLGSLGHSPDREVEGDQHRGEYEKAPPRDRDRIQGGILVHQRTIGPVASGSPSTRSSAHPATAVRTPTASPRRPRRRGLVARARRSGGAP